jgi:hypothetical protein
MKRRKPGRPRKLPVAAVTPNTKGLFPIEYRNVNSRADFKAKASEALDKIIAHTLAEQEAAFARAHNVLDQVWVLEQRATSTAALRRWKKKTLARLMSETPAFADFFEPGGSARLPDNNSSRPAPT